MNARFDIALALAMAVALAAPAQSQGLSNAIGSMDRARNVTIQATAIQHSADPAPATAPAAAADPAPAVMPPTTATRPVARLTVAVPTTISAAAPAALRAPVPANTPAVPYETAPASKASSTASTATHFLDMAKDAVGLGASGDAAKLGLESEDKNPASATDLMKNPETLRLLGDNPRFTYDAAGLQDPMTVPWVRSAAIYGELSAAAEAATKDNELDKAAEFYRRILALGDARFMEAATGKLAEIAGKKNAQAQAILAANPLAAAEAPADLPPEIKNATNAAFVGPGQRQCLVGSDMLSVGQTVPRFPNVKVAAIEQDKVVFSIKDKTYAVNLAATGGASEQAAAKGVK